MPGSDDGSVADALRELLRVFDVLAEQRQMIRVRAGYINDQMASGKTMKEIVAGEEQPLVVQTVRECTTALLDAFSRFQRAEARALYGDGLSMQAIAGLFGISRQRVANFLQTTGP